MKKQKPRKLQLSVETVKKLDQVELALVVGGVNNPTVGKMAYSCTCTE